LEKEETSRENTSREEGGRGGEGSLGFEPEAENMG